MCRRSSATGREAQTPAGKAIPPAGGVIADDHNGQARPDARGLGKTRRGCGHSVHEGLGRRLAVDEARATHAVSLFKSGIVATTSIYIRAPGASIIGRIREAS